MELNKNRNQQIRRCYEKQAPMENAELPLRDSTLQQGLGPGLKFDDGKLPYTLLPPASIEAVVEVLQYGASKYGPNNWQNVEDGIRRYFDAALRHLFAALSGNETDAESGLSHVAHAATSLLFILHLQRSTESLGGPLDRDAG